MSKLILSGDTSGTVTIDAPAIAGLNTMTLAAATGTLSPRVLSTAVASTSGTSIDFTSIPSWVTRITVMFAGVSLSGSDNIFVQIGSGSITSSGYNSYGMSFGNSSGAGTASTAAFIVRMTAATDTISGQMIITNQTGNTWVSSHNFGSSTNTNACFGAGSVALSGTLDRVRVTVSGTNTFDAGSINIMYE